MAHFRSGLNRVTVPLLAVALVSATAFGSGTKVAGAKIPTITSSVDTSGGTPDAAQIQSLKEISDKAEQTGKSYYAKIVSLLGAGKHPQASTITISFTYAYKGVAATGGDHTEVSAAWLTEGIADYVRWFNFEAVAKRPSPRQSRHPKATGSYQTTGAFLFWAVNIYDRNMVKKLNEAMYDGSYKPEIWTKLTGKSLEDLNTEWVATLRP